MPSERIADLEALEGWTWNLLEVDFQEGLEALGTFVQREGHAQVQRSHREGEFKLGQWCGNIRSRHKQDRLSAERIAQLEAIEGWVWDPYEARYQKGLEALKAFVQREGHARVPQQHQEGEYRLGTWCNTQRQSYKTGRMPAERVAQFEAIEGWVWDLKEADFQKGLAALQSFIKREGHVRVPDDHLEGDVRLAAWVRNRRSEYQGHKRHQLSSDRIAQLEAIEGWVWAGNRGEEGS